MCLIAFKRNKDEDFNYESFLIAAENNPHGTGLMYAKNGRVIVNKVGVVDKDINNELYYEFAEQEVAAIHVRKTTHGETDNTNAHPYCILNKEDDGVDLYMMHNGVISGVDEIDPTKSDTWHFVNLYLKPLLEKDPYMLTSPYLQQMIAKFMGSSRLLFMYGDGTTVIIADSNAHTSGADVGGCWLSNKYSLTKKTTYSGGYKFSNYDKPTGKDTVVLPPKSEEAKRFTKKVETKAGKPSEYKDVKLLESPQDKHDADEAAELAEMEDYYGNDDGYDYNVKYFDEDHLFTTAVSTDQLLDSLVKMTQSQVFELLEDSEQMEDFIYSLIDLRADELIKETA